MIGGAAGHHNGEADGGEHEENCGPGGELGEQVGCAARAEGRLRTLTAECAGEIGALALLQQDDAGEEEADDDVDDDEKDKTDTAHTF